MQARLPILILTAVFAASSSLSCTKQTANSSSVNTINAQTSPTSADCTTYKKAFGLHLNSEAINCTADSLELTATGLPDLRKMKMENIVWVSIL